MRSFVPFDIAMVPVPAQEPGSTVNGLPGVATWAGEEDIIMKERSTSAAPRRTQRRAWLGLFAKVVMLFLIISLGAPEACLLTHLNVVPIGCR